MVIKKVPVIILALNLYLFYVTVRRYSKHSAPWPLISTHREQKKKTEFLFQLIASN